MGRLVIETTSKVTGKVLTEDDQRRLGEETVAADRLIQTFSFSSS